MYDIGFEEAGKFACTYIDWSTHVYHVNPYVGDAINAAFAREMKSLKWSNDGCDHEDDYHSDVTKVIEEALRIGRVCQEYFSDSRYNGSKTRWLKVTDDLAINGKAEAILCFKEAKKIINTDYRELKFELHKREFMGTKKVNEALAKGIKALNAAYNKEWKVTKFALRGDRFSIKDMNKNPKRRSESFYLFVFPGIEAMGIRTPIL